MVEELKERGNALFARGDNAGASACYTEALSLCSTEDTGLRRVLFSNRSAARLKCFDFLAALGDAEECIKLAPAWSRGLGRKAMALLMLARYKDAQHYFQQALLGDPNNAALLEHLEYAKQGRKPPSAVQTAPASSSSNQASTTTTKEEEEDDPLAGLFQEVAELEQMVEKKKTAVDHEAECAGWTPQNQLQRILGKHHKFLNLNPFLVFGLAHGANEEDIKRRYHKLSSLLHPDKNPDPNAAAAFEYVTWAYAELKDENRRNFYLETFALYRQQVEKARAARAAALPGKQEEQLTLEEEVDIAIKRALAQAEQNRLKAEQIRQANEERMAKSILAKEPNWAEFKRNEDAFKEGAEERNKNWSEFLKQQSGSKRYKKM